MDGVGEYLSRDLDSQRSEGKQLFLSMCLLTADSGTRLCSGVLLKNMEEDDDDLHGGHAGGLDQAMYPPTALVWLWWVSPPMFEVTWRSCEG